MAFGNNHTNFPGGLAVGEGITELVPANNFAALEIKSTTGGFIVPRMTTAQRNNMTASAGMIIFNSNTSTFQVHNGSAWNNVTVA